MNTRLSPLLLALLLCLPLGAARCDTTWQVVNVDGKEYLTLDNIANFYQLKSVGAGDNQRFTLSDSQTRIETFANPREININGVKQWLSFPMLYRGGQVLVSRFDLAKTIEPCLRPTMIGNLEPVQTVVLDAGHGGQDGGGHTTTGFEKDYTLNVINDLKKSLEAKGLKVVLTRTDDAYLALEQRAEIANTIPDAVFVSVHFNSSNDANAKGLEVFAMTPQGAASTGDNAIAVDQFKQMPGNDFDNASLALATCVHHALLGNIVTEDRGVKRARFAVLRLTHAPAVLVEGGFMTNGVESHEINDPAWRQGLAEAIVAGVRSYQDMVQFKQPPKLLADYRSERLPLAGAIVNPVLLAKRVPSGNPNILPASNPQPGTGQTAQFIPSTTPRPR